MPCVVVDGLISHLSLTGTPLRAEKISISFLRTVSAPPDLPKQTLVSSSLWLSVHWSGFGASNMHTHSPRARGGESLVKSALARARHLHFAGRPPGAAGLFVFLSGPGSGPKACRAHALGQFAAGPASGGVACGGPAAR